MKIRTTLLTTALFGALALAKPDGSAIAKPALSSIGLANMHTMAGLGSEGANPAAGLIVLALDSNLYGTNVNGGINNNYGGTFFKVSATQDRTNPTVTYSVLHHFGDGSVTNDGRTCNAKKLAQDASGYIYGTCNAGGANGNGVIYRINYHTGAVTILHSFYNGTSGNNAYNPIGLVRDGSGNLYGVTHSGGGSGYEGVIFKLSPPGFSWTYTILYRFSTGSSNGSYPNSITLGSDGKLYGVANAGGANGSGVIWRYNLSNSTYTKLIDMPSGTTTPGGGLTQIPTAYTSSGRLEFWGVTYNGGANGLGSVYRMAETSAGSGSYNYTVMHDFTNGTNEGYYPVSDLVFSNDLLAGGADAAGALYGTTQWTLYRIDLSGNYDEVSNWPSWMGGYPGNIPYGLVEGVIGGGGYSYSPVLFGSSVTGGVNNNGWLWNVWLQ